MGINQNNVFKKNKINVNGILEINNTPKNKKKKIILYVSHIKFLTVV